MSFRNCDLAGRRAGADNRGESCISSGIDNGIIGSSCNRGDTCSIIVNGCRCGQCPDRRRYAWRRKHGRIESRRVINFGPHVFHAT